MFMRTRLMFFVRFGNGRCRSRKCPHQLPQQNTIHTFWVIVSISVCLVSCRHCPGFPSFLLFFLRLCFSLMCLSLCPSSLSFNREKKQQYETCIFVRCDESPPRYIPSHPPPSSLLIWYKGILMMTFRNRYIDRYR